MKVFMLSLMSGLLCWPVIGSAELYKWTDGQGNLHITDTPPSGMKKKAATTVAPVPQPASPKKAAGQPTLPGRPQAEIHPVPGPIGPSSTSEEVFTQRPLEGLSPSQATLTSLWQVFDGNQVNAKAPVLQWKDKQGLDHFVDVLPAILGRPETAPKSEDVSASPSAQRTKEQTTAVSRSRHRSGE